jgi:hypothetical protein
MGRITVVVLGFAGLIGCTSEERDAAVDYPVRHRRRDR